MRPELEFGATSDCTFRLSCTACGIANNVLYSDDPGVPLDWTLSWALQIQAWHLALAHGGDT